MSIEDEIDQRKFSSLFAKANINLLYTAGWVQLNTTKELKPFNISVQQFNILRILRGRHPKPASIRELTDRMLDKSSNASRLVDKLQSKNLVAKQKCENDNRRVEVTITTEGLQLLEKASEKVEMNIEKVFSSISEEDAILLNEILDKLRS